MGKSLCLQCPRPARATTGELPAHTVATRGKGDDRSIARRRGDSNVGQVDGMCGECDQNNNHPTTDRGI